MARTSLSLLMLALSVSPAVAQPGPQWIGPIAWETKTRFYVKGTVPGGSGSQVALWKVGNPDKKIYSRNIGTNGKFSFNCTTPTLNPGDDVYVVVNGTRSQVRRVPARGQRSFGSSYAPPGAMAPQLYASAPAVPGRGFVVQTTGSDYTFMPGDLYVSLPAQQTSFLATGAAVYVDLASASIAGSFVTDVNGAMQLPLQVPAGVPQGLTVTLQAIVYDPVAPLLFHATTNGLDVTVL